MDEVLERVRWRVDEFHRMAEAGILTEDDRVELIDGEIVRMVPIGGLHAWTVNRLGALFAIGAQERAYVSIQNPLVLSEYDEPQPDLMLLKPPASRYKTELPRATDVLLLVEVADSTLKRDVGVKLPLYARFGIPEVWIVDLPGARLRAFDDPSPDGAYRKQREFGVADSIAPIALPDLRIQLAEILG